MRPLAIALRQAAMMRQQVRARRRPKVPAASWPSAARVAYLRDLRGVLAVVETHVRRDLLPLLPSILGQHEASRPARRDMTGNLTDDAVDRIEQELKRVIPPARIRLLAQENALRVSEHGAKQIARQVQAVAKINLFGGEQGLAQHIDAFVSDNVRLVKSLAFDQLEDLKGIVLRGARQGLRHESVARQIQDRFGMAQSRAALIARDQVGKLNGEVAQLRQQALGVHRYRWLTARDERVRPDHRALEGTIQNWDKPPIVDKKSGRRGHPGQDYNCRCQPIPVLDDLLADAGLISAADVQVGPPPPRPRLSVVPRASAPPAARPRPATGPRIVPPPAPLASAAPAPGWLTGDLQITREQLAPGGVNDARIVEVRAPDGTTHRAVWKPVGGEAEGLRPGIEAGSYHAREAAMYELDTELGGEVVVPPTVSRELGGVRGSLQAFVDNEGSTGELDEMIDIAGIERIAQSPAARKQFLLDVIGANDDRHLENTLWRRGSKGSPPVPIAIDNGLTFPRGGPTRFIFAIQHEGFAATMIRLDETSVRQLRSLQLERVAAILRGKEGITPRQIREALARIRALQRDPGQLARGLRGATIREHMRRWLSLAPEKRGLSAQDLAEIDQAMRGIS